VCQARCAAGSTPALVLADDGDQETRETIMTKCTTGFERAAHMGKIHNLKAGDLYGPRPLELASEGREIFERQITRIELDRIALAHVNREIERREQRESNLERLWAWINKGK
jgi:hypothetical protein